MPVEDVQRAREGADHAVRLAGVRELQRRPALRRRLRSHADPEERDAMVERLFDHHSLDRCPWHRRVVFGIARTTE
ncbi:MAG TPA: hypothetical protein VGO31_10260 [Microbacteriaceae bacterium]|nr:hypothetical protein [Microbacteriaceae bacterium]